MIKKENFDRIRSGRKHIEVRKGKQMKGDEAIFLCSKWMLKGKIVRKQEGKLTDIVNVTNYREIVPVARNLKQAISYIRKLHRPKEKVFTAYYFVLKSNEPKVIV